jgi:hypothetical protein
MSIDNLQLLVKKRFLRSASLSHSQYPKSAPHIPKTAIPTERFAIVPHIPKKRFLRSASLSHSQHPKTAIPTERFAIALPTSPKQRTACSSASLSHSPHPQKAIPAERFAIALQTSLNSELLAAALRYRTPTHP